LNSFGKFFWGVLLLVIGIIWLAFAMGWMDDIMVLAHWWPMLIIIPCALRLLFSSDRWLSIMGIVIGVIWQLHYWLPNDMIDLRMARMATPPVIIICIALHILLGQKKGNKHKH